jgi:spore coat protein CotH
MRRLTIVLSLAMALVAPVVAEAQSAADVFNADTLQTVELWVHDADWAKLKRDFQTNEYYPADFVLNGQTVRNAAIRSRGLGSRNPTKPGLRVDFDRNVDDQTFRGLKSIILDNLVQDPSTIHETTTMRLFAKMNIPAPREAHVRLFVNGDYIGLYALVESVDKSLLARVFGSIGDDTQNDGYLYEYNYILDQPWYFSHLGSDLDPYKLRFDPKTHETKSSEDKWRPIENLVRLVNELPSDRYMSDLNPHLDLRAFIRYLAAQNFVGQNDGFAGYAGMNNFYFYRLENSSQHVFIAWDEDNAFWGPEFPLTIRHEENVLARKAMEVEELRNLYFETLAEAARIADTPAEGRETPWLEEEVRRQLDLVEPALRDDPSKPYSMDDHAAARGQMITFARERGRFVESNRPR